MLHPTDSRIGQVLRFLVLLLCCSSATLYFSVPLLCCSSNSTYRTQQNVYVGALITTTPPRFCGEGRQIPSPLSSIQPCTPPVNRRRDGQSSTRRADGETQREIPVGPVGPATTRRGLEQSKGFEKTPPFAFRGHPFLVFCWEGSVVSWQLLKLK